MAEPRVLVVDDESFIRDLVRDFLSLEGIACDTAPDVPGALSCLERGSYALILLDRHLEGRTSEDLIGTLIQSSGGAPLVVMTGDFYFDQEQALQAGAPGVLHKPFQMDDLLRLVSETLSSTG